ncbi:MAG TPA: septation protein A [Gammaproteobacteria bacterium]|nr:septation protein A [Gammaproteobacteria bacterium]
MTMDIPLNQFLDFLAILVFAVAFFTTRDIFLATGLLIGIVTLQFLGHKVLGKPISQQLRITFWASLILGGMTVLLRDEAFIQWKTTIVNWTFAAVLGGAYLFRGTLLFKKLFGQSLRLPDPLWVRLTYGWASVFVLMGAVNIWVAYSFSMETWVTYKLVGPLAMNFVFIVGTMVYLYKNGALDNLIEEQAQADSGENNANPQDETDNQKEL